MKLRSVSIPTVSVAVLGCAVFAHVRVTQAGHDYVGALGLLDRIFDLLLAVCVLAVAFCVGRAIGRALGLSFVSLAEELSISIWLGTGAVACAVMALGLAHLLKPLPVAALMTVLVASTWRESARLKGVLSETFARVSVSRSNQAFALLFVGLLVVLTLRTLTPPHAVDEAIYHLSVTKSFVQRGGIHPVYDNFSGNMPFLLHMIYAVCLLAKADIAAKLFSLGLTVVTALSLYGFAVRFLTRRAAAAAMFAFFGAGIVVEVGVTTRIDVSLVGMLFAATYALMAHLETGIRGWLFASAALSGFALGIKYTAGVWILLLAVMYLVESLVIKRHQLLVVVGRGAAYGAIVAAIASPWFIKNQLWFGNPVYPFITGEVAHYADGSIRYFTVDDQRSLNDHFDRIRAEEPEMAREIQSVMADQAAQRPERHPFRFWEFFTKSDLYALGTAEAYHDPNYLFFVAPLALVLSRRRWIVWLGIISAAFYVFFASTSWIARYLLPIYPALTMLAAYALTEMSDKLKAHTERAKLLPIVAVAVAVGSTAFVCAVQVYASGAVSFVTGSLSRRDFMSAAFYYPPLDFMNRELPQSARVLMLGSQMGYDLERPYLAEGGWDSIEWQRLLIRNRSLDEVNEDLKRQGITHILYSTGLFRFVAQNGREGSGPSGSVFRGNSGAQRLAGPDYQVQLQNWATFELYRRKFLETVRTFKEYELLRIK